MTPTLSPSNDGVEAIQEHPEQLPDEQPEYEYGERNEDLPEQLVNALKCAIEEAQGQDKYVRRREVMADRIKRFYERGFQHVYANPQSGMFYQPIAGQPSPAGNGELCPTYIDDYNIFQRYLDIQVAILTQNTPGIDFQPIDPNAPEDIEASTTAESYRKMFDRSNPTKSLQIQMVRTMGLSGRTIIWTRTEANAQKFGLNEDGSPKQMETATIYGTLESKVPITAKSQDDCLYVFLYDDPDIKQAKSEYPKFKDKIKANAAGLGENAYERSARLGMLQGTRTWALMGDGFTHLCTRMHCWLRPANFCGDKFDDPFEEAGPNDVVPEDDGTSRIMTVEEKLCQMFPLGVHAVFVGDTYVGSWAESMDDAITIGFPYEGDGMFRMALMDPMVVVQDRFNDAMNAAAEVFDYGWPSRWVDAEDQEYEAIRLQKADPYAMRQKKAHPDRALEESFYQEPNPELPVSFMKFLELCEGELPQFILATPPALFGSSMEDQRTASGYAQARAQAMGQQGLIWSQMQRMFAQMYYQAALCATRNPDHSQEITIPGGKDGSANKIVLSRLTKGKFGAYPDQDSSFPESTAQKRTAFNGILQQASLSPAIATQINESPRNWETYASLNGFPELVIPEAKSWDKQEFEIDQLLMTNPIPPSPEELTEAKMAHAQQSLQSEMAGGPPAPPFDPDSLLKCSIPAKKYDYHVWELNCCKNWLSSADCRRQQADGNDDGIKNVELHAAEHEKWMQLLAPPPMINQPKPPEPSRPAPPPPPPPVNPAPVNLPATM